MRQAAIDRFYQILGQNLQKRPAKPLGSLVNAPLSSEPSLNKPGLYFFFEPGENRQGGAGPRVTRVGRHQARLWTRLKVHYDDSDNSILLTHMFKAATHKAQLMNFIPHYNKFWHQIPEPPYTAMRDFELNTVLPHVRDCPFTWLPIRDQPDTDASSAQNWRKRQIALVVDLEQRSIALLSNYQRNPVVDRSSPSWLGLDSPQPKIRDSGLWNVEHVDDPWTYKWLDDFDLWVQQT